MFSRQCLGSCWQPCLLLKCLSSSCSTIMARETSEPGWLATVSKLILFMPHFSRTKHTKCFTMCYKESAQIQQFKPCKWIQLNKGKLVHKAEVHRERVQPGLTAGTTSITQYSSLRETADPREQGGDSVPFLYLQYLKILLKKATNSWEQQHYWCKLKLKFKPWFWWLLSVMTDDLLVWI